MCPPGSLSGSTDGCLTHPVLSRGSRPGQTPNAQGSFTAVSPSTLERSGLALRLESLGLSSSSSFAEWTGFCREHLVLCPTPCPSDGHLIPHVVILIFKRSLVIQVAGLARANRPGYRTLSLTPFLPRTSLTDAGTAHLTVCLKCSLLGPAGARSQEWGSLKFEDAPKPNPWVCG